uniref:Ubiquitin-conjugating enzyme E2 Z n=1 Tax=viral metagenome TaxID=1070528 RepID=A0A6C0HR38_9ZZZZ
MSIFIPKDCAKRLIKDIKQIINEPLTEHGVYYKHDEDNILRGYALIVGGEDTPYFGGYYFFQFNFTTKYPYEPPIVEYCTNDGKTRFNPNFYINKKTCLSILNTWKGEQWSSCQTITTILLSLTTVLCKHPLLNEPHITSSHRDYTNYSLTIEYVNIDVAICDIMANKLREDFFKLFENETKEQFQKNVDKLLDFCSSKNQAVTTIGVGIYYMNTRINYAKLVEKLNKLKIEFKI